MLKLKNLCTFYGQIMALAEVNIRVAAALWMKPAPS